MKLKLSLFGWLLFSPLLPSVWAGQGSANLHNYARPCQATVEPALTPLPPGAIEPAGWLRDWAQAAANGITGHLDEYHAVFADAWKGIPFKAPNAAADATGWPLEQCSYWLDGLVRLGYVLHDQRLIAKSRYPSAMGDLNLAGGNVSGLCNLDALLEAYSFTGDKRLLERASAAMGIPPVQAAIADWLAGKFNPGHAVCVYEIVRLPALWYPWTGERQYLEASGKAFQWLDEQEMLPYGVASGEEFLSGVGAFRLTETCDVSASLWSRLWLYRVTGQSAWGDKLEQEFFNAAPAPIARDFQSMCYYQSPNRLQPQSLPSGNPFAPGPGCLKFTTLGYPGVLCCVGNMNRIIPNYIIHMWMATREGGLAATLYGPCTVSGFVGAHVPIKLDCQTAYPFQDTLRARVIPSQKASFPLSFRIPGWCKRPRITVNGTPIETVPDGQGFVRIERVWKAGDAVVLHLPMAVRVQRGFETEYPMANRQYFGFKPDSLFQKRRLPYESIFLGPLLFAFPIGEVDANTLADTLGDQWQLALDNDPSQEGRDIRVQHRSMPPKWNWPVKAPIILKVPARNFPWHPTETQALPGGPVESGHARTIELVPYGCTRFRVSMFPVTSKAWGNGP